MNYKIYNNNSDEWVLLIHGLGGSINTWKYQIKDLNEYNVLAVDLEGHGGSSLQKHRHLLTRSASDIKDILDKENIGKVHVISLSLGTLVAMEFAYLYRDRVRSIVLAGFVLNLGIGLKSLLACLEGIKYIVPKRFFYPLFAHLMMPRKNHKRSRDFFIRESIKMRSAAFRMWLGELFRTQFKMSRYIAALEENKLPVMLISGQEDYFFVRSVKKTKKMISAASLCFLEKCGHVCSIEKYNEFNGLVVNFLHST
ncbi:Pimeloyl-ACP methyl ester carboxylesterase [Ruminococcaceae bacterium YRB3002]|nr:Pimeloyl-ACP methyl ester carboxylesterase [Ruminococcaceae bacterium YRB3002]